MTAPAGWPKDLPPVGPEFEEKVAGWLLDRLPGAYRTSPVRTQPRVLAMAAQEHARATLDGTREVYRGLRAKLRDSLSPHEIDNALQALEALAAEFSRNKREIDLVAQALEGQRWKPRL